MSAFQKRKKSSEVELKIARFHNVPKPINTEDLKQFKQV